MALKSKSVLTGSRSLARSRSTDNLPTSQSQINIQMMSHTLTIREVCHLYSFIIFTAQLDFRYMSIYLLLTHYCVNYSIYLKFQKVSENSNIITFLLNDHLADLDFTTREILLDQKAVKLYSFRVIDD